MALKNLKKQNRFLIKNVYEIGKKDIEKLEKIVRPSGFYKQKAKRIFLFCKFIVENHNSLNKFFKQETGQCRKQLLEISGIGPETADSILLYAGNKLIFVIDEYTRRLVKKHKIVSFINNKSSYNALQELFQQSLPKNVKIYQNFHALIVLQGKNKKGDRNK
jgi:endonuclease-3 related protein